MNDYFIFVSIYLAKYCICNFKESFFKSSLALKLSGFMFIYEAQSIIFFINLDVSAALGLCVG